jgi:hypothetical protein
MQLPPNLQKKYLQRFDELIEEGRTIHKAIREIPGRVYRDALGNPHQNPSHLRVDWENFVTWRTRSVTLLSQVVGKSGPHADAVEGFSQIANEKDKLEWGISFLRGIRDDFWKGFLNDLALLVEAELASDYMSQAEQLLAEGQSGKCDHVPAAVLAGAVLEKALRTLCSNQNPPIQLSGGNGEPKTLNPLIDDLKKAGVFNEAKAKQLRAWAAIRNLAAHGEFTQFKRSDVEQMVAGVTAFLADFLGQT